MLVTENEVGESGASPGTTPENSRFLHPGLSNLVYTGGPDPQLGRISRSSLPVSSLIRPVFVVLRYLIRPPQLEPSSPERSARKGCSPGHLTLHHSSKISATDHTMTGTSIQQAGVEPVDYAAIVASWSPEERKEREKKFLRKIDARLIPILVSTGLQDTTYPTKLTR